MIKNNIGFFYFFSFFLRYIVRLCYLWVQRSWLNARSLKSISVKPFISDSIHKFLRKSFHYCLEKKGALCYYYSVAVCSFSPRRKGVHLWERISKAKNVVRVSTKERMVYITPDLRTNWVNGKRTILRLFLKLVIGLRKRNRQTSKINSYRKK